MAVKYYAAKAMDGRILTVFRTHHDDNMEINKAECYNYEFGWQQDDKLLQRFLYYGDFEVFDHENDEITLEESSEIINTFENERAAKKTSLED